MEMFRSAARIQLNHVPFKTSAEMMSIISQPDTRERLNVLAFTPIGSSRAQFAAYIKSEIIKWGKAVRDSGARAD